MTTDPDTRRENPYFIDAASGAELGRLLHQERLLLKHLGGCMAEQPDLAHIHDVLDIACGPGGWALELAYSRPEIEVVGLDKEPTMVEYARTQAQQMGLDNVGFVQMDALQPLEFSDGSFDLVNLRFLHGFMRRNDWPQLLLECRRVLRGPGGIMRMTEGDTWNFAESPALLEIAGLSSKAMFAAGQSFVSNGRGSYGLSPKLHGFLTRAGFGDIQHVAHAVDISTGTESHDGFAHNFTVGARLLAPFLLARTDVGKEALESLFQQMERELYSSEFCGLWFIYTTWGYTPAPGG